MEPLERIRTLLTEQTTLTLATTDAAGQPRSTPLFYIADDDLRIYWFSARSSLHSRHCALHPAVSVSIHVHASAWQQIRGVQMTGRVEIIASGGLRRSIASQFSARFQLGDAARLAMRRCALYCFTPDWVRYLDNSLGFGARFEVHLPLQPATKPTSSLTA